MGPPTTLQPSRNKKSCLWRVGGRVPGGTLGLWGGEMHSPKCLFSSVCEAAAFRRISIFTKTSPIEAAQGARLEVSGARRPKGCQAARGCKGRAARSDRATRSTAPSWRASPPSTRATRPTAPSWRQASLPLARASGAWSQTWSCPPLCSAAQ